MPSREEGAYLGGWVAIGNPAKKNTCGLRAWPKGVFTKRISISIP
jgi:hypothetical protein